MSRYDDPEGMGENPALGKRRRGPLGRRQPTEDTGAWANPGQDRSSQQASDDRSSSWAGQGRPPGQPGKNRFRPQGGKDRSSPPGRDDSQPGRDDTRPQDRRSRVLGTHPALALAAIATTVMVVGVSLVAYAAVRNVYDGINHETVTAQMLGNRPPKLNGSTNILIIGSDSRAGTGGKFGKDVLGSRSDTSMVLHISPDHTHAYVISFPRDSMVPVYSCLPDDEGHPGQTAAPGQVEPLNATFSAGGAPCLWKTLEQSTHIRIDHFVEVGFDSFQNIVNDVHGIQVCLPFAIHNPEAHLNLPAGRQTVDGAQALAFVRLRENIGEGSDLQRIQRQQLFLASAAQKIKHTNLLADYAVLRDVAHAITTDLTLTQMLSIANSMKGLSTASVRFITVPVVPYPLDPNRVLWETPQATTLFSAVAHDTHILKAAKAAKGKPVPTVSPAKVQLEVLNGSGVAGVAGTTATSLASRGFDILGTGEAPNGYGYTNSVIEYTSATQLPEVNTLKKEVAGAQAKQVAGIQGGSLSLIIGSKFTGLAGSKPSSTPSTAATLNSNSFQGISANQNICNDASAFEGPLSPVTTTNGG
jgi:LCP family protein required for cell wall assembly